MSKDYSWVHPKCVGYDGRICFGIAFFANEEDAMEYEAIVKEKGLTYNGGWYHGMPCGREPSRDRVDKETGQKQYAVTN